MKRERLMSSIILIVTLLLDNISCARYAIYNPTIGDFSPNNTGKISVGFKMINVMDGAYVSYKPTKNSELAIEAYNLGFSLNYRKSLLRKGNLSFSTGLGSTISWEEEGQERYGFYILESPFSVTWFNDLTLLWLTIKPGFIHLNSNYKVCKNLEEEEKKCSPIGPYSSFGTTFGVGVGYAPLEGLRMLVSFNIPYTFSKINYLANYSIGLELGYDYTW